MALDVLDIEAACRLCLSVAPDNSLIFQEPPISLPQLISACVGFQINPNEGMPSKICNMCLKEVNQWAAFRAKCQSTNDVLAKVLYNKCTLNSFTSNLKVIENRHPKKLVLLSQTVECGAVDLLSERQTSKRNLEEDFNDTLTNQQKKIEFKSNVTAKDTSENSFVKDNELNSIEVIAKDVSVDTLQEELREGQPKEVDNQNCVGQMIGNEQDNNDQECHSDSGSDSENIICNVDNDDDTSSLSEESSKSEDSDEVSSHEDDVDLPLASQDESKSWRWKKVKCPKCPKIFPKHYSLKCHMQNIHSLFKCYPCAVCGHTSVSSAKREKHVIKSHEDLLEKNPKRMCKVCGIITKTKPSYRRHLKKHKEDQCCKVCNSTFNSQEELEMHSKTVHEAEETLSSSQADGEHKFKCHHCKDLLFRNEKDWKEHYMLIHFTRAVYLCDLCDKTYRTKEHLEMHKRAHMGEKPYMCDICAVRFTGKSSLRSHMKTHANRKYECKICQKVYSSYTGLYSHNRATHKEIDPFVCHECGKKFKSANGVQFHMRTHTGEKPYSCEHCNFTSRTLAGITVHRVTHSDEKPFKCDQCDKSFKLKSWLKVHKKTHTGVKNFTCDICNHSFIANYQLKSHMKVHSGERPHVCDICSKSFARKDTLTEHRRIHTKETKYNCKNCNSQFAFLKPFKKHKCTFNNSSSDFPRENSLSENFVEDNE